MALLRSLALLAGVSLLFVLNPAAALAATGDSYTTPAAAFEALKSLEGTWDAKASSPEGEFEGSEEFRVSAAGTVVMEIMNPGTPHEMINMYHLDGDDLMLTHYCAGGNQPRMRLDASQLADGRMAFEFIDATNLDPQIDQHIHAARFDSVTSDRVEAAWIGWNEGSEASVMELVLTRQATD